MSHASHESAHHEGGDASDGVNLKKVVAVGVISLVLFTAGIIWAISLMNSGQEAIRKTGAAGPGTEMFKDEIGIVDNVLFSNDNRLAQHRAERANWLNSYGWSDRKAGLIHTPIERAMAEVIAEASRIETAPQLPPPPPVVPAPEPVKPVKATRTKAPVKGGLTAPSQAPSQGAPH